MKSFKDFLCESEFEGMKYIRPSKHSPEFHGFVTRHKVAGKTVQVNFNHHNAGGHYDAHYDVAGSMDRGKVKNPADQMAILKHVHNTINHFIKHVQPVGLHMIGGDSDHEASRKKDQVYRALGKSLAKKHGGKLRPYDGINSSVVFAHHAKTHPERIDAINDAHNQSMKRKK